jgi:NitT/TauT family transport system substrate-binding protein
LRVSRSSVHCTGAARDHRGAFVSCEDFVVSAATEEMAGELRIYGNLSLLEMAPVLLAANRIYSGKTVVEHGGVMSLWGKTTDLPSLAAAGQSDIAANSDIQALRCSFENPDLRFIFTAAECPYRIVCRRSAGITRLADLRGKRIGTMLKSSAEYFLDRMLRTVGMTERDVTIVPFMAKTESPLTLMPQALLAKELDAVTVWEPQMQQASIAIGSDAIEFIDPSVYRERFNLCSTQAKLADAATRHKIVAFVRALVAATERLRRAPQEGWQLVAHAAQLDIETVKDAWPYLTYPGTLAADLLDVLIPADVWVAKETGRAPRTRSQLSGFVDASVVREALT